MESTTRPRARRPLQKKARPPLDDERPTTTGAAKARTTLDLLREATDISSKWRGIVDGLLEMSSLPESLRPTPALPDWAMQWISCTLKEHRATSDAHSKLTKMLAEAVRLEAAQGPSTVWEVWVGPDRRLSVCHSSFESASAALERLDKSRFPEAFVMQMPARPLIQGIQDVQLLDTLVGRIQWRGMDFEATEYLHMIQDETGRSVTVPADVLVAHHVFERLHRLDREQILAQQAQRAQRQAERKAVQP